MSNTVLIFIAIIVIILIAIIWMKMRKKGGAKPKANSKQTYMQDENMPLNNKVYVGNVAYRTTPNDLRELFEQYGQVDDVKIVKDRRTGRSKGFAFVSFGTTDEANASLAATGHEFHERAIVVRIAKEKPEFDDNGTP